LTDFKDLYDIKPSKGNGGAYLILFAILAILKLSGLEFTKDWSWWWITGPLWIPLVFYFILITTYVLVWIIVQVMKSTQK
jgi:hypothetical protein